MTSRRASAIRHCVTIATCFAGCEGGDAGAIACIGQCEADAGSTATNEFNSFISCVATACNVTGDGGGGGDGGDGGGNGDAGGDAAGD